MRRHFVIASLLAFMIGSSAFADTIPSDREAFTQYMKTRLQLYSKQPLVEDEQLILRIGDHGSQLKLINEYNYCQSQPAFCEKRIDNFVQDAAETALHDPPLLTRENLRAGLGLNAEWLGDPMGDGTPLGRPLVGMLDERCYINPQKPYPLLRVDMLDTLSLSRDEAFDLCEKNLRSALGPMSDVYNTLPPDRIGMVRGTQYEGARMLLIEQWVALQQTLGGTIIVAVPEDDIIVFSNSDDDATVAAVEARAKEIAMSSANSLEYDVYRFKGHEWDELTHDERGKMRIRVH